jgi:regulatory factor X
MDITSHAAMNAAAGHDDSGIGIRSPDEDFTIGKYDFSRAESQPHLGNDLTLTMPQASVV